MHRPASYFSTSDPGSIAKAIALLRNGGVIALPTDTVYGLACDGTNPAAIDKLFAVKGREKDKPVAICLNNTAQIPKWASVQHLPDGLLDKLMPGPVTLVFDSTHILNQALCHQGKIGIRIPNNHFIRDVCQELDAPLALTSANLSKCESTAHPDEFTVLWDRLDGIFDGGTLSRLPSTVVDLTTQGQYRIIRPGYSHQPTKDILHKFHIKPL